MSETVYIHVDGAASGNPGPASVGAVLRTSTTLPSGREVPEAVIAEIAESIGQATNNEAEYHAVLRGLAEAKTRGYRRVRMYSDSQLVVRQVRGEWACREERLGRLRERVVERSGTLDSFELIWIPRTRNRAADRLATEALDALLGREGRQDEYTFHNFQQVQSENQRLQEENRQMQEENRQMREEIQTMKNQRSTDQNSLSQSSLSQNSLSQSSLSQSSLSQSSLSQSSLSQGSPREDAA